jgi:hypothetical protein
MSLIWISKFGRLKILKNQKRVRTHLLAAARATPLVATTPRGHGLISMQDRAKQGLSHFAIDHAPASPLLCSATLNRRGTVGANRLRPPPGPNNASLSSAVMPRYSSTSTPAPSTPSPCSHHQFPSIVVPP